MCKNLNVNSYACKYAFYPLVSIHLMSNSTDMIQLKLSDAD